MVYWRQLDLPAGIRRLSAIRIVGGQASGRRLVAPKGLSTRPTGERVREALFSMLGSEVVSACVLDLYAGSGALSIEAMSRGADSAVLVEPNFQARQAIKSNLRALASERSVIVKGTTAERFVEEALAFKQRFSLVFCDPPWLSGIHPKVLMALADLTTAQGLVIIEHPKSAILDAVPGMQAVRTRHWGDTAVTWYRPGLTAQALAESTVANGRAAQPTKQQLSEEDRR